MATRASNIKKTFDFQENGHGSVEKEAKVDFEFWSPTIQILQFTDHEHKGEKALRFGYCDDSGQKSRALYLSKEQLEDLGREVATGDPEIKEWLTAFFKACFGRNP
jgi:hypothetical protein